MSSTTNFFVRWIPLGMILALSPLAALAQNSALSSAPVETPGRLQAPQIPEQVKQVLQQQSETTTQKATVSNSNGATAPKPRYRLQFYPEISEATLKKAGLNNLQIGEFKSVEHSGRTMSRALISGVVQKRKDLLNYLNAPNAQQNEAVAKADELAQLTAQLNILQVQNWFKLRSLLKPAQLVRLSTLLKDSWANDAQFSYNKP